MYGWVCACEQTIRTLSNILCFWAYNTMVYTFRRFSLTSLKMASGGEPEMSKSLNHSVFSNRPRQIRPETKSLKMWTSVVKSLHSKLYVFYILKKYNIIIRLFLIK